MKCLKMKDFCKEDRFLAKEKGFCWFRRIRRKVFGENGKIFGEEEMFFLVRKRGEKFFFPFYLHVQSVEIGTNRLQQETDRLRSPCSFKYTFRSVESLISD